MYICKYKSQCPDIFLGFKLGGLGECVRGSSFCRASLRNTSGLGFRVSGLGFRVQVGFRCSPFVELLSVTLCGEHELSSFIFLFFLRCSSFCRASLRSTLW